MSEVKTYDSVIQSLDRKIAKSTKEGIVNSKGEILYANEETKTVVYLVSSHNGGLANARSKINYRETIYAANEKGM